MNAQLVTPERVKALRRKHGWTQAQAAPKLNICLRTLVSLEKGVRMRALTLVAIDFAIQEIEKAEDGSFFASTMCKNGSYVIDNKGRIVYLGEHKETALAPSFEVYLTDALLTECGGVLACFMGARGFTRNRSAEKPIQVLTRVLFPALQERGISSIVEAGHHALFLSGNAITVCASRVRRAIARTSDRFSSIQRATPAHSLCATASSHSARAAFRHCAERFKAANSKLCSEISEASNRYESGGMFTDWSPWAGLGQRALLAEVRL